jgi:dipeptidase E
MKLLLLSNSRNADGEMLQHAREAIAAHLAGITSALFIPYAGVTLTYDDYVARVQTVFAAVDVAVQSIHQAADPERAVQAAESIVIGGGNTFRLLERLQHHALLDALRERVRDGAPYIGWSAGSVIACPTIGTTNDMPIVAPQGFGALGLVPFQINAHFTDAHPPGFRGETRRERLAEYLVLNPEARVVGLPEGSWLEVTGDDVVLRGPYDAPVFSAEGATLLEAAVP